MMKALFIYPPSADPTLPPLSQARVAPAAHSCGLDLRFIDENLRFIKWVFLRALDRRLNKIFDEKIKRYKEMYKKSISGCKNRSQIERVHSALLFSRHIGEEIKNALSILRSSDRFFNISDYLWACKRIQEALYCFSALYGRAEIGYGSSRLIYNPEDPEEIAEAIIDSENNPYIEFFSCRINLYIEYSIVFISVIYSSQIIPAMTIARLIKDKKPSVKVIFGGPCASAISDGIMGYFGEIVDAVGRGDGDYLFEKWKEKTGENSAKGSTGVELKLNEFMDFIRKSRGFYDLKNKPEYSLFKENDYPLPVEVFPLDITRGCYWKKCVFCAYGFPRAPYRRMPISHVIELIEEQKFRRGVDHYFFSVDTVDPGYIKNLAKSIISHQLEIRYYVDLRMEKSFTRMDFADLLYKSGCRVVSFGMESCYRPTLELMKKGIHPEYFSDILKGFSEAGIHINIHVIHGFPGDPDHGINTTFEFLDKHKRYITTAGVSRFTLLVGSPLEKLYRDYGITRVNKPAPFSLYYKMDYDTTGAPPKDNRNYSWRSQNYPSYENFKKILLELFPQAGRLTGSTTDYLLYASRYEPDEMKNILEQAVVLLYREG